jgi:hypothetical protein
MQRTHTVLSEARAAERERQAELARPRVGGALEGESV